MKHIKLFESFKKNEEFFWNKSDKEKESQKEKESDEAQKDLTSDKPWAGGGKVIEVPSPHDNWKDWLTIIPKHSEVKQLLLSLYDDIEVYDAHIQFNSKDPMKPNPEEIQGDENILISYNSSDNKQLTKEMLDYLKDDKDIIYGKYKAPKNGKTDWIITHAANLIKITY